VTLATLFLDKFLAVMSGLSLGRLVSNLKSVALTVFELLAFNSYRSAAHTQTDRQTDRHTSNEHIISAIHFVHLAEIITIISLLEVTLHKIVINFHHYVKDSVHTTATAAVGGYVSYRRG